MSDLYLSKNGDVLGRFSMDDIQSKIDNEEIGAMDHYYCEIREEWRPLGELGLITGYPKVAPPNHQSIQTAYKLQKNPSYQDQASESTIHAPTMFCAAALTALSLFLLIGGSHNKEAVIIGWLTSMAAGFYTAAAFRLNLGWRALCAFFGLLGVIIAIIAGLFKVDANR